MWKPISTVPVNQLVDVWVNAKRKTENTRFCSMRLLPNGEWFGPRQPYPTDKITHWYDYGDGKTQPDPPK